MKLLITGSNGLLGQKLVANCIAQQIDFQAISSGDNRNPSCPESNFTSIDITDFNVVEKFINENPCTHIIHTAAMTNVDACELDPTTCYRVNHLASKHLFEVAQANQQHFTLLSTDFVFDGKTGNYSETDLPNPLSVYGKSKWFAEQELINSTYTNWAIARTIIVYGIGYNLNKSNIFSWLMNELTQGKEVSLITDHFRAPTWAEDLAAGCMAIAKNNHTGIYHLCGPETLSIFEIGIRVARFLGVSETLVNAIDSNTLNQPAPRPPHTGFNLNKAKTELGYEPHTIEQTLEFLQNKLIIG
jgi:dTDP-4-dehydrorhamnose reductase